MTCRWRAVFAVAAATAVLTGACAAPADRLVETEPAQQPAQPPTRTTWALRHQVTKSEHLRVVGKRIGHYDESTSVSVGKDAQTWDHQCSASVSAVGQGGPDNMVGEKLPTRVHGRPGFRSGAGAEGDYLMWQLPDGAWVLVSCGQLDDRRSVDLVAAAVRIRKTSIAVPFDLGALPDGYGVSSIQQDLDPQSSNVYVGAVRPAHAEADLQISYDTGERRRQPKGRAITINGRQALLDEEPRSPAVCILVQNQYVCLSSSTDDYGPYPDRSKDVPTLLSIARALTFAQDLTDQSTWYAADRVFG